MSPQPFPGPEQRRALIPSGQPFAGSARDVARVSPALRLGSRTAAHDPRWPAVVVALARLREQRRRALRIVDADCGSGCLLLHALRHARAIGFTAIEGRGIDGSPALIARATAIAARFPDPAIGVTFEVADMAAALSGECDLPADIVLWHGLRDRDRDSDVRDVLRRSGDMVIGDEPFDVAAMPRRIAR